MSEVVVALFPVGPYGPSTQGGHLRDPKVPGRTRCGKEISDKSSTVRVCQCSPCFTLSGGTIRPHPWPVVPGPQG